MCQSFEIGCRMVVDSLGRVLSTQTLRPGWWLVVRAEVGQQLGVRTHEVVPSSACAANGGEVRGREILHYQYQNIAGDKVRRHRHGVRHQGSLRDDLVWVISAPEEVDVARSVRERAKISLKMSSCVSL